MTYFIEMFKRTFDFQGRSNIKQYWFAILFYMLFGFCAELVALPFVADLNVFLTVASAVSGLYEIVLFLPTLSLTIRRLHDTGRSGFFVLLSLFPIVGTIILIVLLCQPSYVQPKIEFWSAPNQDDTPEQNIDENK